MSESLENTKYPKNVILFIGDGMSLPTVTAARILKGQKYLNVSGEEQYLTWERFPESAFLKVLTVFPHIVSTLEYFPPLNSFRSKKSVY